MDGKQLNLPSETKPRARFCFYNGVINLTTIIDDIEREGSDQCSSEPIPSCSSTNERMPYTAGIRSMEEGDLVNVEPEPCTFIRKRKLSDPFMSPAKMKITNGFMMARLKKLHLDRKAEALLQTINQDIAQMDVKDPLPEVTSYKEIEIAPPVHHPEVPCTKIMCDNMFSEPSLSNVVD